MSPEELGERIAAIFLLAASDQLPAVRALRKQVEPQQVEWFYALVDVGIAASRNKVQNGPSVIVVLLHGILTEAVWQDVVADELESAGDIKVFRSRYEWIDPVRFWVPFRWRFAAPVEICLRELRDARRQHPTATLVVIAHSFSTYLMAKILEDHRDVVCGRVLLCGSVVPRDYRWDKIAAPNEMQIVNEVGTRDFWPVLARVTSWGYGASGTFGFNTNRVVNRFFDWGHSDFFSRDHVRQYWLPFVQSGHVVKSPWTTERPVPSTLLSVGAGLPYIKVVLLAGLCGVFMLGRFAWAHF